MTTRQLSLTIVQVGTMKRTQLINTKNTESWASFGRLTEEQKKNASVTAYFYGTGLEIKGYVDPGHGIYRVTLDGRKVEYQDGLGNASEYNGRSTSVVQLLPVKVVRLLFV